MSFAHKDQHRSMKTTVQSKLSSAFKTRRHTEFANGKLIAPSGLQSECSTLVDFGDDYTIPYEYDDDVEDDGSVNTLSTENSAWARGAQTQAPRLRHAPHSKKSKASAHHAQMLDADDMSWNLPKSSNSSIPARILHALAGQ